MKKKKQKKAEEPKAGNFTTIGDASLVHCLGDIRASVRHDGHRGVIGLSRMFNQSRSRFPSPLSPSTGGAMQPSVPDRSDLHRKGYHFFLPRACRRHLQKSKLQVMDLPTS
jgi:hypothetical protein